MEKSLPKKIFLILLTVIFGYIFVQSISLAQVSFPTRSVTIWIGFPPGGVTDIITRTLAEVSEKGLGQKIVAINKPGGGGSVCASLLTKAKPDGYTLGAYVDTPITRAPHLRDLDYDPFQDLTHIIRVGLFKQAFVVRADSPFKKWEDVVNWAKKNPGQLVYGHPGAGTTPHITMAKVALKEGFTYKHVPFAGGTPNSSALLGGHVMISGDSAVTWKPHVEAKTIRVLLVFEKEGLDYAPDTPTFEKVHYDFETSSSLIISAPKGIPGAIREILEKAFIEGIRTNMFKAVAEENELLSTEPLTQKSLNDYLTKCYTSYEQSIKEAGIYKIERK